MTKIITTITKPKDSDRWPVESESDFTQKDFDEVLNPYSDFLSNLPGFIATLTNIEGNVTTNTMLFRSKENAKEAFAKIRGKTADPIALKRNELFAKKSKKWGINYVTETRIVD